MSTELAHPTYRRDCGHGLIARWSTQADTEKIALLLATVHRDSPDAPLNPRSLDLARSMMSGAFPYMGPGDFAVVEDTAAPDRPLVACTCLWRHRWLYGEIPLNVGRPEYVATLPEYRNRGLVRMLFDMIHARSAAEGHLLQAITGIPYFYRQFGYEFVLDLEGSRTVQFAHIPDRKADEPEACRLRPATPADIPLLIDLYRQQRQESLIWYEPDAGYWHYVTTYWTDPICAGRDVTTTGFSGRYYLAEDPAGQVVGASWVMQRRWGRTLYVVPMLSAAPDVDRRAVLSSLLRHWRTMGLETPAAGPEAPPCSELKVELGREHPLYELLGAGLAGPGDRPYAWYVRIADLPAFLWRIAPVLEARLAQSALAGYTGELKIDLYRDGLHLHFVQGKLLQAASWRRPPYGDEAKAGAPPLVFLQLLLSYRSLAELRGFFPDVWVNDEAALLLETLFPRQRSLVFAPWG